MEYDAMDNPLLSVVPPPPLAPDGTLAVPTAPGTGLELAADKLEPWIVSQWSEKL